jgi:hypothetical protein
MKIKTREDNECAVNWIVVCIILYNMTNEFNNSNCFAPAGHESDGDAEDSSFEPELDSDDLAKKKRFSLMNWVLLNRFGDSM